MSEIVDVWVVAPENTVEIRQMLTAIENEGCVAKWIYPDEAVAASPATQPRVILMDTDLALRDRVLPRLRENGVSSFVVLTRNETTITRVSARDVTFLSVFAVDNGGDVQTTADYVKQAADISTRADEAALAIDQLFMERPRYRRYKSAISGRFTEGAGHGHAIHSAH